MRRSAEERDRGGVGRSGWTFRDTARYAVRISASALSLVTLAAQAYAAASVRRRATRARFAWSTADTIPGRRLRRRQRVWAGGYGNGGNGG